MALVYSLLLLVQHLGLQVMLGTPNLTAYDGKVSPDFLRGVMHQCPAELILSFPQQLQAFVLRKQLPQWVILWHIGGHLELGKCRAPRACDIIEAFD